MQYRRFGKLDLQSSLLGFGTMRLPVISGVWKIDQPEAIRMIRHAIDQGVNYVDTAWPYHGGDSEPLTGEALRNGYRDRTRLATKNPTWLIEKAEDWDRYLDQQLQRLGTDHIDFYLQHAVDAEGWQKFQKLGLWERAMKAKAAGKIKHFGFSFHDEYPLFTEMIDAYDWDFCQIQLNYIDTDYQAGLRGLAYANAKNIGVVIMEPLRGGRLATRLPEQFAARFAAHSSQRTPAEWALRWVASQPGVVTILSGMSCFPQLEENLSILSAPDATVGAMTDEELTMVAGIAEEWRALSLIGCTGCNYCQPCPNGVNIPACFNAYNYSQSPWDDARLKSTRDYALDLIAKQADGSRCLACGQCEAVCPQGIKIIEQLKAVDRTLRY